MSAEKRDDLEDLYRREWPTLLRVAYLLTGSEAISEELVQDSFVRLQRAGDRVANPGAYVRTSVVNAACSYHRHRAVRDRTVLPRPEPVLAVYDELGDALSKLSWRQHAVVVLRYYLGLTEADIAETIGCRPSTVRSLERRALAVLRKELS